MARADDINQFLGATEFSGAALSPLAGDASFRRYIRVAKDGKKAMLMDAPPDKEDVRPYLTLAKHLRGCGYSTPTILAEDAAKGFVLIEDFGDDSFTRLLGASPAMEAELYGAAIDLLAEWHKEKKVADAEKLPLPAYDVPLLMREVNLFSDWYLPQALGKEEAAGLRAQYQAMWQDILAKAPLARDQLVHRDYHVDNLMWLPGRKNSARIGLLDFQDGVYGDAAYDVVSLLEDARRDVPEALAQQLTQRYLAASGSAAEPFKTAYAVLGAQRNSKIIGIFVRLATRDGKDHYLRHLPRVWRYLERDLAHPSLKPLKDWLDRHVAPSARGVVAVRHNASELAAGA